jgi:hypothetical protein
MPQPLRLFCIFSVKYTTYHGPIQRFCDGLSRRVLCYTIDQYSDKSFQKSSSTCLEMVDTAHSDVTGIQPPTYYQSDTRTDHMCHRSLGITAFYNIFRVQTISQASTRAGQLGLLHVIPLLSPMQIVFSSHALDISLINAEYTHITLGSMAVIQGCLHCILNYAQETRRQKISAFEIMVREKKFPCSTMPLTRNDRQLHRLLFS